MKRLGSVIAGAAGLLGLVLSNVASADLAPTCTSTQTLTGGASGANGIVQISALFNFSTGLSTGLCVQSGDKLWGNWSFSNTFDVQGGNVAFTVNQVGGQTRHQIAFNITFTTGEDYTVQYEVQVNPPGGFINELDADFTQTTGSLSTLTKNTTPTGTPSTGIDITKTNPTDATGPDHITYPTNTVNDIIVHETLLDRGTVSSLTNTVIEGTTPEPASLALVGLGLSALGLLRRRRSS